MLYDTTTEIVVQEDKKYYPRPHDLCKVQFQGSDFARLKHTQKKTIGHVQRVDENHYRIIKTGEVKEYMPRTAKENRKARIQNMRRSFQNLNGLLRCNFVCDENRGDYDRGIKRDGQDQAAFITLTYSENMKDTTRLRKDFQTFFQRLQYAYPHDYTYITVAEPQGRGAWHLHMMLRANDIQPPDYLWFDKERLTKIWQNGEKGKGSTFIARLKSNDVGAYYTAYFTGVFTNPDDESLSLVPDFDSDGNEVHPTGEEIHERELLLDKAVDDYASITGMKLTEKQREKKKAHIKGARLGLYPKNFHFLRCSNNAVRPTEAERYLFEFEDLEKYERIYSQAYSVAKVTKEGETVKKVEPLNQIFNATYRRKSANAPPPTVELVEPTAPIAHAAETFDQLKFRR